MSENPRVGGSIPPLATIIILAFRGLTVTSATFRHSFRQESLARVASAGGWAREVFA
jgi:hypothetical protein